MRFNLARMLIATKHYAEAIPQLEALSTEDGPERPAISSVSRRPGCMPAIRKGRISNEARALAAKRGQLDLVAAIDRQLAGLPQ